MELARPAATCFRTRCSKSSLHQRGLVVERITHLFQPGIRPYPAQPAIPIPFPFPLSLAPGAPQLLQLVSPALPVGRSAIPRAWMVLVASQRITSACDSAQLVGGELGPGCDRDRGRRPWARLRWPCLSMARTEREQGSAVSGERPGGAHRSRWLAAALREAPSCGPSSARCWTVAAAGGSLN